MKNFSVKLAVAFATLTFSVLLSASLSGRLQAAIQAQSALSPPSPQPVGTAISISATATNSNKGPTTYRFEIAPPGSSSFVLVRDFAVTSTFKWVPTTPEGNYQIRVTARDYRAHESSQTIVPYRLTTLINGGQPALTLSTHPLVALFSAPPCASGTLIRVRFARTGTSAYGTTDLRPCAATSTNFLIAGLSPAESYTMSYQLIRGQQFYTSPVDLTIVTGVAPSDLPIAPTSILVPATAQSSPEKISLISFSAPYKAIAYDKGGRYVWYYPDADTLCRVIRPLAGGTMMVICSGPGTGTGFYGPTATRQQILREIDLAGNTLHEISADRVSEYLQASGKDPIERFNHDAIRISNGHTVVLADTQRAFPTGTQGATSPVDLIGAVIVDLDPAWKVGWNWNSFDHAAGGTQLDANRAAIRGEACSYGTDGQTPEGCPRVLLPGFSTALDWLHSNSLDLMQDGALLMSIRNQDWLVKIDYANGTGNGDILWRMGFGGDFAFNNNQGDPYPWFSGQHEAAWEYDGTQYLSVFDNGNTRLRLNPGSSRGQVLLVDEPNRTVTFFVNADLGVFAFSHGSAQALSNGNWVFQADKGNTSTQVLETTATSSTQAFSLQGNGANSYRSWRLRDFYGPPKN